MVYERVKPTYSLISVFHNTPRSAQGKLIVVKVYPNRIITN